MFVQCKFLLFPAKKLSCIVNFFLECATRTKKMFNFLSYLLKKVAYLVDYYYF